MAKKRLYDATVFRDGKAQNISVDITALPYGKFDFEHPLLIKSDVVMDNGKKKLLPDFSNVVIMGAFDCSSYTINADSKLPIGITELICLHSVNDLDVLTSVLPDSVRKVVVRTAILNSIKKESDNALGLAQNFIEKYPYTVVTDGKTVLSDVLNQLTVEQVGTSAEKVNSVPVQVQTEQKTDEWLSMDELIFAYKQDKDAISGISDENIQRAIRIVRKKLNKRELMREDGVMVNCIHRDELPSLVVAINQQQKRDSVQRANARQKEVAHKTEQVTEKSVRQTSVPKLFVGNKELQKIVIKKYIKNNVWKEIQKHCKNDLDRQLEFLESIEVINIKPVDTAGKKVCYIQDGVLKTSSTVTFKNIQWLTQGFSTLDDRARIIWCMNEHGFIATEYFEEHEKKQSVDYKKAIRNKDVAGFTTVDTLSVSDLIKELTAEREAKQANAIESVCSDVICVPADVQSVKPVVQKQQKRKRVRIHNKPNALDLSNVRVEKYDMKVENLADAQDVIAQEKQECQKIANVIEKDVVTAIESALWGGIVASKQFVSGSNNVDLKWNDVDSLQASFTVMLSELNSKKSVIVSLLSSESNTENLLDYTADLRSVLEHKQVCEKTLCKLEQIKSELNQIRQDFLKLM